MFVCLVACYFFKVIVVKAKRSKGETQGMFLENTGNPFEFSEKSFYSL